MSGVVLAVLGFGLEPNHEPSKCNVRAAELASRFIREGHKIGCIVAQWEPALGLRQYSLTPMVTIHPPQSGEYLSSEPTLYNAALLAKEMDAKVMVIANPVLHLQLCRRRLRQLGVEPLKKWPGWIGFNRKSSQWQDRSLFHLAAYAVLQVVRGRLKPVAA